MGPIEKIQNFSESTEQSRETLTDFLQMIVQYNVKTIVMMTSLKEKKGNRIQVIKSMILESVDHQLSVLHLCHVQTKCAQYWPDTIGETMTFDDFKVTLLSEEYSSPTYDIRLLRITRVS